MKVRYVVAILLASVSVALAQHEVKTDDVLPTVEQWLQANGGEGVLDALGEMDPKELEKLCRNLQERLQRDQVLDLASLRSIAVALLPLLEKDEETKPYAPWLRAHLDDFDVAVRLRASTPSPGLHLNPPPQKQRDAWQQQLANRPLPQAAENYVSHLKPIFTAQGVPAELVWLAEVESKFDPRARSPSGAVGLFQLMPATAIQQGLSLRPDDERLNPEKSAQAAAKRLRSLHGSFRDWRLALAAYNAGESRVRAMVDKYKAKSFDDIALHLPAETQLYVPKVEATIQRREGVPLARLGSPSHSP